MPTVLTTQGFRFFFYSNENDEPVHVHVSKADAEGNMAGACCKNSIDVRLFCP